MAGAGGPHSANSPCNLSRSLDRILLDAQATCELKLSGRKLKEYPKGAVKYNLSDTVVADLSKNRFSELPGEVTDYTSLEQLNLYHNVIKHLPESVANLQSLTHLNLSRNQLSVVPGCVCGLGALRVLDLSGNRLVSLPEEVGQLRNLMDLDASYNQLAHLPPALGELDTMRRLNLRRNLLQTLPPELCFLRLVFMDLSCNRIAALPTELRFMSSLITLILENNPLQHPPSNLCTRGRVHIFKWLEMAAAKEDKKRGILSSETEFRKMQLRKPSSCTDFRFVNGFFDPRQKRSTMDSGYSTCESIDHRWSQESQEALKMRQDYENVYTSDHSPVKENQREYVEAKLQKRAMESNNIYRRQGSDGGIPLTENGTHRSAENLSQRTDTASYRPTPMGAAKPCNGLDGYSQRLPSQPRPQDLSREDMTRADVKAIQKEAVLSYVKSRVSPTKGSSSSSPDVSFDSGDGTSYPSSHTNSSHPQHSVPHTIYSSSLYTSQNVSYPVNAPQATSTSYSNSSNPYTSTGQHTPTLPPQTITSSTHTTRGSSSSLPKTPTTVKARKRSGGGRPFDPDSSPAHLSFTYRRELEKQQHEKQLIENLRNIIETRLKVSLPADISAALMDGVVLCHLANHVRPRSVSSIHVPSPAVPKLTIAKCRLNVENFLEACRKIGVEEACVCACDDIVTQFDPERVLTTVRSLVNPSESLLLTKSNGVVLDPSDPHAPQMATLEEPQTSQWDNRTAVLLQPFQAADQHFLSNALLCIFLATLVLLYWYPPPDE
ncbi:leucine-rich repeat and calponin homology domain-containing protein isoform X9 [Panulirus ornatus]|uniref:leucine-rich repeat and calponin homology domain-containing protein isoform X9 n=1 Tax=Panulirus ornatus TaxID=150431 RepID=UPI003A8A11A1